MSYGVPCVVSNAASIPEVVGDAAVKINPNDINEIAEGILKAENYQGQNKDEVLAKFSWEKCARETRLCYLSR